MLQSLFVLGNASLNLAQGSIEQTMTPNIVAIEGEFLFSIPQFFLALFAGLVMAFAFQFLLTNLAIAFAATPGTPTDAGESKEDLGDSIKAIETKLGLFVLFSVSIALFAANFLAVRLSLIGSATLGAIVGVVVWSAYFSLLVWFGSSAVGSLVGSFISTATSGLQGMMGAATSAIGANVARSQAVSTAEDIAAAVRQELTAGIDPKAIQATLSNSIASLPLPKLDFDALGDRLESIVKNANFSEFADSDVLKNLNRDSIVKLISDRTDFSKDDLGKIADRLESAIKQTQGPSDVSDRLLNLVKTATPDELRSSEVYAQLEKLVKENTGNKRSSLTDQALEIGLGSLLATVRNRVDLSDLDVDKISNQLQGLLGKGLDTAQKVTDQVGEATQQAAQLPRQNTIKADVEAFVLGALPWYFNRFSLPQEFEELIYDPQANPSEVRWQLEELTTDMFSNLLTQRGDLSPAIIQESAAIMTTVRDEVLNRVRKSEASQRSQAFQSQFENYLRSTDKTKLTQSDIQQEVQQFINDPDADLETLQSYFGNLDQNSFRNLLNDRTDFSEQETNQLVEQLSGLQQQVSQSVQTVRDRAQQQANELRDRVENYLRNTNREELNPDAIEREVRLLFDDPQAGISALRSRLSQFDRETLVQLLTQRGDLSEEQINQTIDQIESIRVSILNAPRQLADKAKQQYEQTSQAIADYLRNTNLEELNPEGIQRDLQLLLADPKLGASALGDRLSHVDRETLVKLLAQRGDLSEEQINQTIDQVQDSIRQIVNAPRRAVSRLQKQAVSFERSLEDYLRNTHKEELNPDGIKRDLQTLLNDPRAGLGSLGDRISHINRETLVALLAQREDISEDEAKAIVDQILSVRDRVSEQVQQLQHRFQSAIDSVSEQVRSYLNSLDRPELNYEGIEQDFAKLFDDPKAGAEALRTRLGQFDRGTLVALLSSNPNLSEADADRIVSRIESARDGVLSRAEYVQHETQRRLKEIRHQAQKQAIATQKMAAGAAWWLFSAAFTSLAASAIAGFLAVRY